MFYNYIINKGETDLKIALFTDSFLPGIGGTENVVLKLAHEFSKDNEVIVFAPNYHRPYEENLDLPFKVVRAKSLGVTKNEVWAMPSITKKIKKTLDDFKPDVIHNHTIGKMAAYANKYAKKHGIPIICTVHTKFSFCYKWVFKLNLIVKLIYKTVIRRANAADRVTSVSESMNGELIPYGLKKPLKIIRNGNYINERSDAPKTPNEKFTMLYVGMINEYKNLRFSLNALKELKKTRSDFVFYMVGRGPHEKRLKKLVKKLGLIDNVMMTGAITDREKLKEIYRSADLLLFTSVFDNDSMVLIEAAENGTPALVLKDTGSAERYVDGETGFIAENSISAVAQKIGALMEDKESLLKVGKNAHSVCIPWETIVAEYLELYKEEIEKKKLNAK